MCYSVQIEANYKRFVRAYGADDGMPPRRLIEATNQIWTAAKTNEDGMPAIRLIEAVGRLAVSRT